MSLKAYIVRIINALPLKKRKHPNYRHKFECFDDIFDCMYSQKWHLFYNFNKQEYFKTEDLFVSQQLTYALDLRMTTLNTWRSRTQTKKSNKDNTEHEFAVFEGIVLFQVRIYSKTRRPSFFFRKSWILNEAGCKNTWALHSKFRSSSITGNVCPTIRF